VCFFYLYSPESRIKKVKIFWFVPNKQSLVHLKGSRYAPYFWQKAGEERFYFSARTKEQIALGGDPDSVLLQTVLGAIQEFVIDIKQEQLLDERVLGGMASYLQDPPVPSILEEVKLLLFTHPHIALEYLGRNHELKAAKLTGASLQVGASFIFDIAGGKRNYAWCIRNAKNIPPKINPKEEFSALREWLLDPNARVVLSMGSGGMRMLSLPAVLKIIDMLGARSNISEIWGCSGGSVMGYLYSNGVAPHHIEQLGYDFYNARYKDVAFRSSLLKTFIQAFKEKMQRLSDFRTGIMDVQTQLCAVLADAIKKRSLEAREIPFFAISTNYSKVCASALAAEKLISPECRDLIVATNPLDAVFASSAIPFIFEPHPIRSSEGKKELWLDGMISEEVPLFFPYIKWRKERNARPEETPPKLKIFAVELGMRACEFESIAKLAKRSKFVAGILKATALIDLILDNRISATVKTLNTLPHVEVVTIRLSLGRFAVLEPCEIPHIIQQGRACFLGEIEKLNAALKEKQKKRSEKKAA